MRNLIFTLVIGLTLSACTKTEKRGIIISVLEDFSELDFIAKPNPQGIQSSFGLEEDSWKSATFRYGAISSLIQNRRAELRLEGGGALFGNQLARDAEIKQFNKKITAILSQPIDSVEHQYSSIWQPLIEELKYLQIDSINESVLYLYSDLQENNRNWFSVHQYKDLVLLEKHPEQVKELFLQHATGIQKGGSLIRIVVVYQPRTMEEDQAFAMMRALYSSVFSELEIPIEFTANLN